MGVPTTYSAGWIADRAGGGLVDSVADMLFLILNRESNYPLLPEEGRNGAPSHPSEV